MKTPADRLMESVVWVPMHGAASESPNECAIPYVTHTGKLDLAGIVLDVVQLSDGSRVIPEESLIRFLEGTVNP